MRVIVCGGRNVGRVDPKAKDAGREISKASAERAFFSDKMAELHAQHSFTQIIAGNEGGAERLGINWAERNRVPLKQVDRKSRETTLQRNSRMLHENHSDIVIAFGSGESTDALLAEAEKNGVQVIRIEFPRP